MRESREEKRTREREKAKARKKRRSRIGAIIAIIIILIVAFTALRVWIESKPGNVDPIVTSGSAYDDSDRINILFLGTNQGLADTIMVFSFDSEQNRLEAVSVPRDTYYYRAEYAGAAYQKINSVFSTEGIEGCAKAVSDVLDGIPIHYYAETDSEGIAKIVDAMGGVEMDVPIDMDYEDPDQDLYIHLKAGYQLLNGDQAVQYLRFRSAYADGDLGRVSAQQEFLKAAVKQSAGLNFFKVATTAKREVDTNISTTRALGLVMNAVKLSDGSFNTYTIPGTPGMQDGLSYYFADETATAELIRQIYFG